MNTLDSPAARVTEATITAEGGAGEVTIRSVVAGPAKAGTAGSVRTFALNGTEVAGIMDIAWDGGSVMDQGHSVAEVPEGNPIPSLYPGIAFQTWGDDYQWTATSIALPAEEPATGAASALALPRGLASPPRAGVGPPLRL